MEKNTEGEFFNGLMQGYGKMYHLGELFYVGNFVDNLFNGKGKLIDNNGIYIGDFVNGQYHGRGVYLNSDC